MGTQICKEAVLSKRVHRNPAAKAQKGLPYLAIVDACFVPSADGHLMCGPVFVHPWEAGTNGAAAMWRWDPAHAACLLCTIAVQQACSAAETANPRQLRDARPGRHTPCKTGFTAARDPTLFDPGTEPRSAVLGARKRQSHHPVATTGGLPPPTAPLPASQGGHPLGLADCAMPRRVGFTPLWGTLEPGKTRWPRFLWPLLRLWQRALYDPR